MNNLPHLQDIGQLVPETRRLGGLSSAQGGVSFKGMSYCRNTCFFGGEMKDVSFLFFNSFPNENPSTGDKGT